MSHMPICCICSRELGGEIQSHHLKPVVFKFRTKDVHDNNNRVSLHKICHQKIHTTFSENELLRWYHTPERLLEHEEIQKFVGWVKNKPLDFFNKNNDTVKRKQKRKI